MEFSDLEIFRLLTLYTPRQVDIICSDPKDLPRKAHKNELKALISRCDELYDFDILSLLNSKYDLSEVFESDEMEWMPKEERQKAGEELFEFIKKINPDFEFPE